MIAPVVSVLTTVYNREEYLPESIESVLASSFDDFEYIIVDDCSTDRSYEIALDYSKCDSRIRVYRNEQNLGDYPNRNRAAALARGKYLKYVDSDDLIYPHGLEVMVSSMKNFPEAALGLSKEHSRHRIYPFQLSPRDAYIEHFLTSGLFHRAPLPAIIRSDAFHQLGGFSGRRYVGDAEMWLKLARYYPVVKIASGLTWRRVHGQQEIFQGLSSLAYTRMNYQIGKEALSAEDCPLSTSERSLASARLRNGMVRSLLRLALLQRKPVQAGKIWFQCGLRFSDLRWTFRVNSVQPHLH